MLPRTTAPTAPLLPDDLEQFWLRCGGVELFVAGEHPWEVGVVEQFVPADLQHFEDAMSPAPWAWVVANAYGARTEPLSIDLRPERLGRCYDSFWDVHASPGNQPVVALSFTELLEHLLDLGGADPDWQTRPYGDAYDGDA